MALFDAIMRGSVGLAKGIGSATYGFARATPAGFMMAGGAVAGAGLAVARGDNHDSTSLMRNIIGGGAAGAAVGLGVRGLFSKTALRGAGSFLGVNQARSAASGMRMAAWNKSPVGKILGTGRMGARGAMGASAGLLGFAARHPAMTMSAGILAGGAIAMSPGYTTEDDQAARFDVSNKDIEQFDTGFGRSSFANSASGLCFGLHSRRHN